MSDSLRPHELQHARCPCPSPSPRVHSDSCPSSPWCHPAISSSVVPFSSYPQSLPASEAFPMSQLFAWGGQSIGVSALAISPSKEHPGLISFRMDCSDLLAVQGTLKSLLQHHSSKASILRHSAVSNIFHTTPYLHFSSSSLLHFVILNPPLHLHIYPFVVCGSYQCFHKIFLYCFIICVLAWMIYFPIVIFLCP